MTRLCLTGLVYRMRIETTFKTTVLIIVGLLTSCSFVPTKPCNSEWRITGYYTPVESDFQAEPTAKIVASGIRNLSISKSFLEAVQIEGWGKLNTAVDGKKYLGYYGKRWHLSDSALNASGKPLTIGQVAADERMLSPSSEIYIVHAAGILSSGFFIVTDVGSRIRSKHIDVYTGEGKEAEGLTYKVTRNHATVCIL